MVLLKDPGIRWYNLQELLLCINKCALTPFIALRLPSEGNTPQKMENQQCWPTAGNIVGALYHKL